jgi:hypothetical protein
MRVKTFEDEEIVCNCADADHDAFVLLSAEDPEVGYPIGWNLCQLSIDQHERQIEHHFAVTL